MEDQHDLHGIVRQLVALQLGNSLGGLFLQQGFCHFAALDVLQFNGGGVGDIRRDGLQLNVHEALSGFFFRADLIIGVQGKIGG